MKKPAIVLLSGGLDSTTTLAMVQHDGYDVYALSFRYGQRHEIELEAAQRIAQDFSVAQHLIVDINLRQFGGSALTSDIDVPKGGVSDTIPVTYVPARNTIFLSFALAWAEVLRSSDIFIGVNTLDYSGYPDCRPEFIEAFQRMANLATKTGINDQRLTIHTPLINLTKAEIIQIGLKLGIDYSLTISCYDPSPDGQACGSCDACILRQRGFDELHC